MICIFVIMLSGWCRMRMRSARLVSNAFLYTTYAVEVYIYARPDSAVSQYWPNGGIVEETSNLSNSEVFLFESVNVQDYLQLSVALKT